MGWFDFHSQGRTPRQRSYHARGGVSRGLANGAPDNPMTVEDVVRNETFWGKSRGQVVAFLCMGFGGFLVWMVISFPDGFFRPGWGSLIVGGMTLALLVMPLLFWIRFQQQRRLYERVAEQEPPDESSPGDHRQ